jgi:hypothetical protein
MAGDFLGLAYAGCAFIDGVPLLMMPSGPNEQENLIKSQGSVSTQIRNAVGEIPVRDRRVLEFQLACLLNSRAIPLIGASSFDWWLANINGRSHHVQIFPANDEGYDSPEAYIQSISINSQENSLVTLSFSVLAYRWLPTVGHLNPRFQKKMETFFGDENWPIPSWLTSVQHTGMPGITSSWTLAFNNNYQFLQLLEGTVRPPTPRLVYPGPTSIDLSLTNIAEPGKPPQESGTVVVRIGGGVTPAFIPQTVITIPYMYRDPQQSSQGVGEQNGLIRWQVGYKAINVVPAKNVIEVVIPNQPIFAPTTGGPTTTTLLNLLDGPDDFGSVPNLIDSGKYLRYAYGSAPDKTTQPPNLIAWEKS